MELTMEMDVENVQLVLPIVNNRLLVRITRKSGQQFIAHFVELDGETQKKLMGAF